MGKVVSYNIFKKYYSDIHIFTKAILSKNPDFIVPVEKKGCKLLRFTNDEGSSITGIELDDLQERIRYYQFFENTKVDLNGRTIAIVDDATKHTSQLWKYRQKFEKAGAKVLTYSFVGHNNLKENMPEWRHHDKDAKIYHYLNEATYQEYILQQSKYLSGKENHFDIDHFVVRFPLSKERFNVLVELLDKIGEIKYTNDVYTPPEIKKITLFHFNYCTAVKYFCSAVSDGQLQKIRITYNRQNETATVAAMSFPIWDSTQTRAIDFFKNIPFMLPYEHNEFIKNDGIYMNLCYVFHVELMKNFLKSICKVVDISDITIVDQDICAFVGDNRALKVCESAKLFFQSEHSKFDDNIFESSPKPKLKIDSIIDTNFESVIEIMDTLRGEYEKRENENPLEAEYFLSYEEIFEKYTGYTNLTKWIDILSDRGALVARNRERNGVFFRACRSGEPLPTPQQNKTQAILPIAVNLLGAAVDGEFEIDTVVLDRILVNFARDIHPELHTLFSKPYLFGPRTYANIYLNNEKEVSIYDISSISRYCTHDRKKKMFRAPNTRYIKAYVDENLNTTDFAESEIYSYLGFIKRFLAKKAPNGGRKSKITALDKLFLCRNENVFEEQIYFALLTIRAANNSAALSIDLPKKNLLLNHVEALSQEALKKLKYNPVKFWEEFEKFSTSYPEYQNVSSKITESYSDFSVRFENKKPKYTGLVFLEKALMHLMCFSITGDLKNLADFVDFYSKQSIHSTVGIATGTQISKDEAFQICNDINLSLAQEFYRLRPPKISDARWQERDNRKSEAINKLIRFISDSSNEFFILHFDFSGYRNIIGVKSVNVSEEVRRHIFEIIGRHNGVSIDDPSGTDEFSTLVFRKISDVLNFSQDLDKHFADNEQLQQVAFYMACLGSHFIDVTAFWLDWNKVRTHCSLAKSCYGYSTRLVISDVLFDTLHDESIKLEFRQVESSNEIGNAILYEHIGLHREPRYYEIDDKNDMNLQSTGGESMNRSVIVHGNVYAPITTGDVSPVNTDGDTAITETLGTDASNFFQIISQINDVACLKSDKDKTEILTLIEEIKNAISSNDKNTVRNKLEAGQKIASIATFVLNLGNALANWLS